MRNHYSYYKKKTRRIDKMKKDETLALFRALVNGKTLRPDGDDFYYIRMDIVPNAWKNEDQTALVEGPIIRYRHHGSSAIQLNYQEFLWLLDVIFKDVKEFTVEEPSDNGHELVCNECGHDLDEQRMLEVARYELDNGVYTLVIEGTLLDGSIIKRYEFNDKGFNTAYAEAKEAWDEGELSKCMIILVEDDQPFMYRRPDMVNFEDREDFTPMRFEDTYIYGKETLDSLKDNDRTRYNDEIESINKLRNRLAIAIFDHYDETGENI